MQDIQVIYQIIAKFYEFSMKYMCQSNIFKNFKIWWISSLKVWFFKNIFLDRNPNLVNYEKKFSYLW